MNIQVEPTYIRNFVISLVLVFLLVVSYMGFRAGQDTAKAELTQKQVAVILAGLKHFYADQDRFPSNVEFNDPEKLGVYVSTIPIKQQVSKLCPKTISYSTFNARTFVLSYCLPKSVGDKVLGVHMLTERDLQ